MLVFIFGKTPKQFLYGAYFNSTLYGLDRVLKLMMKAILWVSCQMDCLSWRDFRLGVVKKACGYSTLKKKNQSNYPKEACGICSECLYARDYQATCLHSSISLLTAYKYESGGLYCKARLRIFLSWTTSYPIYRSALKVMGYVTVQSWCKTCERIWWLIIEIKNRFNVYKLTAFEW